MTTETAVQIAATIDLAAVAVMFHPTDRKAEDHADQTDHLLVREVEDLKPLSGSQLVALFNATRPEGLAAVNKFSTKDAGITRLWANLQRLGEEARAKAKAEAKEEKAKAKAEPAPAPAPAKAEPAPAPAKAEPKAKAEPAPAKEEPKTTTRTTRLKDKSIGPAPKVFPFRDGSIGAHILALVSRPGGIHIDDFIAEMNVVSKNWTRGNAWGSARYFLFDKKGYGLKMVNEILSVKEK